MQLIHEYNAYYTHIRHKQNKQYFVYIPSLQQVTLMKVVEELHYECANPPAHNQLLVRLVGNSNSVVVMAQPQQCDARN